MAAHRKKTATKKDAAGGTKRGVRDQRKARSEKPKPGRSKHQLKRDRQKARAEERAQTGAPMDTFPSTVHRIKPGQILNPDGKNQYTYRKDAEATFERLLRGVDEESGLTVAERILVNLVVMARDSDKWAIERVLERILPKIEKTEHDISPDRDRLITEIRERLGS